MKRSEMIDEIACELVSNAPYHTDLNVSKLSAVAESILDWIEERGMLPPEVVVCEEMRNMPGVFTYTEKNEWEQE